MTYRPCLQLHLLDENGCPPLECVLSFENSISIYYIETNDLQRYFPIYEVIWEISHFSPMQFNWALVSEIFMILQWLSDPIWKKFAILQYDEKI